MQYVRAIAQYYLIWLNLKIDGVIAVISGAKDEGYNLKYNNKRIDSKWNQLS
jgi:hypothetical protein